LFYIKSIVPISQTSMTTESMSTENNNQIEDEQLHPTRNVIRRKLHTVLRQNTSSTTELTEKDFTELTINIEESIHEWACDFAEEKAIALEWTPIFSSIYVNKAISIYTNLDPASHVKNPRFKERVLLGEITPEKVPTLSPQEMFPEKWKTLLDEKFKIDKQLYETRTEAATDIYKCGKCQKRVCTYFQLQTRSADEPMTTFVTCLNCGNRWKH